MKQKIHNLIKSEGLRQSAFMAFGNIGATGFSAISLIILSRFLGPEDFGGFSVAFSLTQVVSSVGDFGFNLSLQRLVAAHAHEDDAKTASVIQLIGIAKLITMGLAILSGFIFGPVLSESIFHVSDPALITLGVGLGSIVLAYGYVLTIVQALAKFALAVTMNAGQAILKCGLAIVSYFYLSPNPTTAYLWYGLAPLIAIAIGSVSILKYFKHLPKRSPVWQEIIHVARFGAVAVIAIAIADNIDILMVNASLTEYQTGLYAAASRVALMLTVFAMSFGVVFNTRVAKYRNTADLGIYLSKALVFAVGSLLLIPIGLLVAKPLLLLTAGTDFLAALPAMNYLIVSAFIMMAAIPFIAVFYAVDFPAYFAVSGVIQSVILIAGNALFIPLWGIEGAGVAKLITRLVVTIFTILMAYHHAKRQFNITIPKLKALRFAFNE